MEFAPQQNTDQVLLGNQMQLELADLIHQDVIEFIEKNAVRFREVVGDDPSLFSSYQKDREGTLQIILKRMQTH